ncbi:hypothetical protein C7212DRAFT_367184 [Tuber magnatum]|uniref:Uncharacterized protein n=1 Tax=Tuber magnatum TaxID=42249 RepID=A0A317SCG3_9PEZI|nr:hypothetical protein C7212DRAFT_367184 [Tuber magnatum]
MPPVRKPNRWDHELSLGLRPTGHLARGFLGTKKQSLDYLPYQEYSIHTRETLTVSYSWRFWEMRGQVSNTDFVIPINPFGWDPGEGGNRGIDNYEGIPDDVLISHTLNSRFLKQRLRVPADLRDRRDFER